MERLLKNLLFFVALTLGAAHQVAANELRATWYRGEFTALVILDKTSKNWEGVRIGSPAEYRALGAELPKFYNKIQITFDRQSMHKAYLHASDVKNPDNFSLVFFEVSKRQTIPLIYNVSVSDFGVLVEPKFQHAVEDENLYQPNTMFGASNAMPRRADRHRSSSVKDLLEELEARGASSFSGEASVQNIPAVNQFSPNRSQESLDKSEVHETLPKPIGEVQMPALSNNPIVQSEYIPDKNSENLVDDIRPAHSPQYGYAPMTPDFVLSSASIASDLGHYKTVFTMASFFVFFLALSILFLMIARFVRDDRSTPVPALAPSSGSSKDESFSNKAFEIQAAQLDRVIALLAQGNPQAVAGTAYQSPLAADISRGQPVMKSSYAPMSAPQQGNQRPRSQESHPAGPGENAVVATPQRPSVPPQAQPKMRSQMPQTSEPPLEKKEDMPSQSQRSKEPRLDQREGQSAQVRHASDLSSAASKKVAGAVQPGTDARSEKIKASNNEVLKLSEQSRVDSMEDRKSEKLDLITVYRDMGDFHMARSLARGLAKNGDEFEKIAAQKILDELK